MKLILIRHGESEGNLLGAASTKPDPPLTERGRRQAKWSGDRLRMDGVDILYCGPVLRNLQTATIISDRCGKRPTLLATLFEVGGNQVAWGPKPAAQHFPAVVVDPKYKGWPRDRRETREEGWRRAEGTLNWLRKCYEHTNARVALVSHGTLNDMLVCIALGLSFLDTVRFVGGNCSFHILDLRPGYERIDAINDQWHIGYDDRT